MGLFRTSWRALRTAPWTFRPSPTAHLAVRTAGDPVTIVPAIRRIIREADPRFPIGQFRSLDDEIALSILDRRMRVVPAFGLAAVALTVALVGVFALLSRAAAEGRREWAIRLALGASRGRVLRIMLGRAAVMTALGTGMGLLGNAAVAGGVRGLLYGIAPHDPLTSFAVISFVVAAAMGAAALPARHASRVDPLDLLRTE